MIEHTFGGNWTHEKLERVRKYLVAYTQIMKKRRYSYAYIDAFAGTGYISAKENIAEEELQISLPELLTSEVKDFVDGSARVALQVEPRFRKYIFIEKSKEKVAQLEKLKCDFPEQAENIEVLHGDANQKLLELCQKSWHKERAVLFLDPYGMQIPWSTIERVAATNAIDLWYLFPIGVAINRLLKRDGDISDSVRARLNDAFGENDWFEIFYRVSQAKDIFGESDILVEKTADFEIIKRYFIDRLSTIFPGVAQNPLWLTNSKNTPLYLLCFACSNKYAASIATKIAQEILNPPKKKRKLDEDTGAQLSFL